MEDFIGMTETLYSLKTSSEEWHDETFENFLKQNEKCDFIMYGRGIFDDNLNLSQYSTNTHPKNLNPEQHALYQATTNPNIEGSFANHAQGRELTLSQNLLFISEEHDIEAMPAVKKFWEKYAYPARLVANITIQQGGLHNRFFFVASLSTKLNLTPSERQQWEYFATHLGSALRLQEAASQALSNTPEETSSGVLSADGQVVDLFEEPLKAAPELQEAIRFAAKNIDKARGKLRRTDPLQAMELWKGLVDGQFSLVDHFDTDGKRYILLKRNAPETLNHRALSYRERQVFTAAAQGLSNKLIAYELGLNDSTVSTLLQRAFHKLNISSRLQLIELAQQLLQAPSDEEPDLP